METPKKEAKSCSALYFLRNSKNTMCFQNARCSFDIAAKQ